MLSAFSKGYFCDACVYDADGGLWPIVKSAPKNRSSYGQRLLPWRQIQVELQFGPRSQVEVADVIAKLAVILGSKSEFTEAMTICLLKILQRFEGARTPLDVIRIADECMGT